MDTSKTYIKMCDWEEIQEQSPQVMIGSVPHYYKGRYSHEIDSDGVVRYWPLNGRRVWLPLQDQLQEMVPTNTGSTQPNFKMISELNHFYDYWDTNGIPNTLTTWEQLWLAFVMKEKYGKVWDGENWQKEDR